MPVPKGAGILLCEPSDTVEGTVAGELEQVPTPYLGGATPAGPCRRSAPSGVRALSSDLWIETWAASLAGLERVVADDVRFENEASAVQGLGGFVLRIERAGAGSTSGALHASEVQPIAASLRIRNDGAVADLIRDLDTLLRDKTWATS